MVCTKLAGSCRISRENALYLCVWQHLKIGSKISGNLPGPNYAPAMFDGFVCDLFCQALPTACNSVILLSGRNPT